MGFEFVVTVNGLGDEMVDESVGTFGGRLRGIVVIALAGVVVCELIDGMVSMQVEGIVRALSDILVGTLAGAVVFADFLGTISGFACTKA